MEGTNRAPESGWGCQTGFGGALVSTEEQKTIYPRSQPE